MAVGIWMSDAEGNLLVTRRSKEKRFAPGKWENSGGHVQAGEAPEAYRWVSHEEFATMRDAGDFAPSVFEHMKGYYDAFLAFMGWQE